MESSDVSLDDYKPNHPFESIISLSRPISGVFDIAVW